ncbi:S41 family peptidase [Filobacillus milosensis]|nr:S41 family peptidase [Filobacillus milosensis]
MKKIIRNMTSFSFVISFLTMLAIPASAITVEDVKPIIEEAYFEEVDESIYNGTVDDVFNELDPYSTYYTDEEYNQFMNSIEQSFVGIGISFEVVQEGAFIQYVFPGSPAEQAELEPGDIIIEVDGESLNGASSEKMVALIGGDVNTTVNLTIKRGETTFNVNIQREEIQAPIVQSGKLAGNIGYIHFSSFPGELTQMIQQHKQALNGVDGWIVDIRNNGGGLLTSAQKLLGMFEGIDTTMVANFKEYHDTIQTIDQDEKFSKPMNLLINEYSASASEIFAAALKDYEKATLFGNTTFGKGRMQNLFDLPEGGIVKLTVATFLSPFGNIIDGVGVEPHIKTNQPLEDAHWDQLNEVFEYNVFQHLEDINPDHQFKITLNQKADLETFKDKVKLATLGGELIDFEVDFLENNRYEVSPNSSLKSGGEYAMYIQPGWTNSEGRLANEGAIVRISVSE